MATDDLIDDLHGMSGAYALDALEPLERARYEEHLETCADCREEVDGFRETAVLLSAAVGLSAPPADLRTRVLTGITRVRPLPPTAVPAPRAPEAEDAPAAAESDTAGEGTVLPLHRGPRGGQRRWASILVAAAVALVLGVGVAVTAPWQQDQTSQGTTEAATIGRVLTAKDRQSQTQRIGGGTAEVVRSASVGRAVVVLADVRAPRNGRIYQLWLLRGQEAISAGLVPRGEDQTILLKGDASLAQKAAISVERPGGSKQPSPSPAPTIFDFEA